MEQPKLMLKPLPCIKQDYRILSKNSASLIFRHPLQNRILISNSGKGNTNISTFSSLFNARIRHFLVSTCQSFERWTKQLFMPQAAKTYELLPEVSLEFRATGISWISSAVPAHRRASSHSTTGQASGWEAKERILHGLFSFLALVPKTVSRATEKRTGKMQRGVYIEVTAYARS